MSDLWRPLFLVTFVLLVPIMPFLLGGAALEGQVNAWLERRAGAGETAALVVAILATDIFLPVPSSMVATYAGAQLGWLRGGLAAWCGMSIAAVLGFGVARRWGKPLVQRFLKDDQVARGERAVAQWGRLILIVARGLPVVAEATVLLSGMHRMPWSRFLPPVLLSNLGLAVAYTAFGEIAAEQAWLPTALAISAAFPVLLAVAVQRWWCPREDGPGDGTDGGPSER